VSGLGTLISGAYVAIDIGKSAKSKREFVALEVPPIVTEDVVGRFFTLKTPDLGSLNTGTPIYFRRLQVGEVASYVLDPDGRALSVKVFVRAPYDQYVTPNTRFWQASGVDVSLSADGLHVQTQSVLSVLIGGIASRHRQPAPSFQRRGRHRFHLVRRPARGLQAGRPRPQTSSSCSTNRSAASCPARRSTSGYSDR